MQAAIAGFTLGFSLIIAIGAQNAFVLRQGVRREHVLATCLTCAFFDALLIAVGVAGFGALTQAAPWAEPALRYGGAAFLIWYGATNFLSAWRGGQALEIGGEAGRSVWKIVGTLTALTLLNPHVYLDTVVLLGSVSAGWDNKPAFAIGAMLASGCWFFLLGYGARYLTPLFAKPAAWRILDIVIGMIMWAIAFKLLW